MVKVVLLPMMGQTMEEGAILQWFKEEGDYVRKGETLFEVMTDKANIEVDSTEEGYLRKVLVPLEQSIPVNTPIALVSDDPNEPIENALQGLGPGEGESGRGWKYGSGEGWKGKSPKPQATEPEFHSPPHHFTTSPPEKVFISPRARRIAEEHGVSVQALAGRGTGAGGRVMERDVLAYLEGQRAAGVEQPVAAVQPAPAAVVTPTPLEEQVPSLMRRLTAEAVTRSYHEAPHVTLFTEADAEAFVAMRARLLPDVERACGLRLTYTDLLVKAAAIALSQYPRMNVSWSDGKMRYGEQVNVGFAVALEEGLSVPVVREADRKGLVQIVQEVHALTDRARASKLRPEDLQEGTFTVSNLGSYGIDGFTPILTPGQAGILGVGRIVQRPAVHEGQLCIRHTMILSLSFDHRAIDGAPAAEFLATVKNLIEEPFRWVL